MQHEEPETPSRRSARAVALAGLALVIIFATIFLVMRPYSNPGPVMRDLEAYYSAGATWAAGQNAYSTQIWTVERTIPGVDNSREEILPFLGPPVSLPFWAGFARLPYADAVALWSIVLGLALIVLFTGSFGLAGRRLRPFDAVIIVTLAAAFGPISSGFSLGQAALAATGFLVAALLCAQRLKWAGTAFASFATVLLKPNAAFALLGILRSRAGALWLIGTAAVFLLANIAVVGLHGIGAYQAALLLGHTAAERFSVLQLTPTSTLFGFGMSPLLANVTGSLIAIVALVALTVAIFRTNANEVETSAMACAMIPFISPFLHEHDLVVVFFPAMYCVCRARGPGVGRGRDGRVVAIAVELARLYARAARGPRTPSSSRSSPRSKSPQLAEAIPWRLRLMPFTVAAVVAVFWIVGPHTVTPLWPSGLPAHFTVTPGASVSAAWEQEQRASGLERVDAFAASARVATLAGCALIYLSLVLTVIARRRAHLAQRGSVVLDITAQRRPEPRERDPRAAANVDG